MTLVRGTGRPTGTTSIGARGAACLELARGKVLFGSGSGGDTVEFVSDVVGGGVTTRLGLMGDVGDVSGTFFWR